MSSIPRTGIIRTFVPAKDFELEKQFYLDLGFNLGYDAKDLCVLNANDFSFYLQDYYVKEWAENFMMFLQVENIKKTFNYIQELNLKKKYPGVQITIIKEEFWGHVFRIITPTGVLWHLGEFKKEQ